jgi:hypothetical protein
MGWTRPPTGQEDVVEWASQVETRDSCPACGHPAALLLLGTRSDHLHRWRPWTTTLTHLYLCAQCDALRQVGDTAAPSVYAESGLV